MMLPVGEPLRLDSGMTWRSTREEPRPLLIFVDAQAGSIDTWRTHWPAEAMERAGWPVRMIGTGSSRQSLEWGPDEPAVVILHMTNQVIDRAAPLINHLHRWPSTRVVIQFDDDYLAHRDIQTLGPWYGPLMTSISEACHVADGVIVATPELAETYQRWTARPVQVVRNYMPTRHSHATPWRAHPPRVGYMGYVGALNEEMPHRLDIEDVWPVLGDYARTGQLQVVGDAPNWRARYPELARNRVVGPLRPEASGAGSLYAAMGKCRVGVTPLREHRWNRGKSWIKAVEYAYQGVPVVMPSWHPGYNAFAHVGVPCRLYGSNEELREAVESYLSLDEDGWMMVSEQVRRTATFAFDIDRFGVEEWAGAIRELAPTS